MHPRVLGLLMATATAAPPPAALRQLPFTFGFGGTTLGSCGPGGLGDTGGAACPCHPPNCSFLGSAGWGVVTTTTNLDAERTLVVTTYTAAATAQSSLQVGVRP